MTPAEQWVSFEVASRHGRTAEDVLRWFAGALAASGDEPVLAEDVDGNIWPFHPATVRRFGILT